MDRRKFLSSLSAASAATIAGAAAKKQNSKLTWAAEGYDDGYYATAPVGSSSAYGSRASSP